MLNTLIFRKKFSMYNSKMPNDADLPSSQQLLKSTFIAAAAAGALLVTVVMPSEYGIDPTGVGQMLGLKSMGEIKVSLAEELAAEQAAEAAQQQAATVAPAPTPVPMVTPAPAPIAPPAVQTIQAAAPAPQPVAVAEPTVRTEQTSFTLAPNAAVEIKALMDKGATVTYIWQSSGGKINFDVHGDSEALSIRYHNYEKGSVITKQGEITAAFDGAHGWFWRNRSGGTVTVDLQVSGDFNGLNRVK